MTIIYLMIVGIVAILVGQVYCVRGVYLMLKKEFEEEKKDNKIFWESNAEPKIIEYMPPKNELEEAGNKIIEELRK